MSDLHLDEFYADVGAILAALFSVFPRPLTLYAEDICGPDEPDEYGVHGARYQACFATLMWLGEEGFIRFNDTIGQDAVDQAVLTARCFSRLIAPSQHALLEDDNLPPSVAAARLSNISAIRQARQRKAPQQLHAAVTELLQNPL